VIEAVCLTLTGLCVLTGLALFAVCARRDDGFLGLAALAAMIIGAVPATVYGGLTS
jgi:hypothetical protein